MKVIAFLGLSSFVAGCPLPANPRVGAKLKRLESGQYAVEFSNCLNGKTLDIAQVHVFKEATEDIEICSLKWVDLSVDSIWPKWVYGTRPSGYAMNGCNLLEKDQTYRLSIMGAGGGLARFHIGGDGGVAMIGDECSVPKSAPKQ